MPKAKPEWWQTFFDSTMREVLFDEKKWVDAGKNADSVARMLKLKPGAKVLDIPCGTGRYSFELAARGFAVVGVDLTEDYIEHARSKQNDGSKLRFEVRDMAKINFKSEFDAIVNIHTSFGYHEREEMHLKILKLFAHALKRKGKLLLDTVNRDYLVRNFNKHIWNELPNGELLQKVEFDYMNGKVLARWTVIKHDGTRHEYGHKIRIFMPHELSALGGQAGLKVESIHGDLDGADYGYNSPRLVMVFAKK